MHADKREEIDTAEAGDIVAIMGIDCASGDTYAAEPKYCTLESMFVPEPVIKMAINPRQPRRRRQAGQGPAALPPGRSHVPRHHRRRNGAKRVIAGMGELHLDIYVERIRREYKVEVEVGAPKVSYREAPTKTAEFNFKHKKQTGGSGQYAHIVGKLEPLPEDCAKKSSSSRRTSSAAAFRRNTFPSVEKGFRDSIAQGPGRRVSRSWA